MNDFHFDSEVLARLEKAIANLKRMLKTKQAFDIELYLIENKLAESIPAAALLLFYHFTLRSMHGDSVSNSEYLERFPKYASVLKTLFEAKEQRNDISKTFFPQTDVVEQAFKFAAQESSNDEIVDNSIEEQSDNDNLRVIGPYTILHEIGQGGMGTVFVAEQSVPVHRQVALKLIRSELVSKDILARFEGERQALARMSHENIAKVLDAGTTDDGVAYFVMELVHGIPITEFCDNHSLTLESRFKLFLQTCLAIQHAHQKGIIHRDIKPSNVLVAKSDSNASVKVIDFGVAKAIHNSQPLSAESIYTKFGEIIGTPQYMSPEQADTDELGVDTRIDVFALGVLLYELLTGSTPIEEWQLSQMTLESFIHVLKHQDPLRPSQRLKKIGESAKVIASRRKIDVRKLSSLLKRDLDWIVIKALEKDRNRRYDSPVQLAEDVQRYLNNEPIIARSPSVRYRFSKIIKRHRSPILATTLVMFALLVGIFATSWQWNRARLNALHNGQLAEQNRELFLKSAERSKQLEIEKNNSESARSKAEAAERRANEQARIAELAREKSQYSEKVAQEKARINKQLAEENGRLLIAAKKDRDVALASQEQALKAEQVAQERAGQLSVSNLKLGNLLSRANYLFAYSEWKNNRVLDALKYLDEIPKEFRNIEWDLARHHFDQSETTFYGHSGPLTQVATSLDNRRIITEASDHTVRIWNANSGKELFRYQSEIHPIQINLDGTRFLTIERKNNSESASLTTKSLQHFAQVRSTSDGEVIASIPLTNFKIESVTFSSNGEYIAALSDSGAATIWSAENGDVIRKFSDPDAPIQKISLTFHDNLLITLNLNKTCRIWDPERTEVLYEVKYQVDSLYGCSSANRLVAKTPDNSISIIIPETSEEIASFEVSFDHSLTRIGNRLVIVQTQVSGEPQILESYQDSNLDGDLEATENVAPTVTQPSSSLASRFTREVQIVDIDSGRILSQYKLPA